ncbi:MAG: methyltransferase family protein [Gemmatimonadaceae bacterium]
MFRIVLRLTADSLLVALLLFAAAGTIAWPRAWVLLAAMFIVRVLGAVAVYRVNASLMLERARLPIHQAQRRADRVLLLGVLATGFLGLPLIAGLDVFHWHLLPAPMPAAAALGLLFFVLGWSLKSLALRANAFAVSVVRLQTERAHVVVDSGPYALVRHPFYAADPLILVGLGLWLQSWLAVLCAALPLALMVQRLQLEERFLREALPGYVAYMERVRFRLIPRIW